MHHKSRSARRLARQLTVEHLEHRSLLASFALTDLGSLANSGFTTAASDINEAGQVVGSSVTPANQSHAFLWENGAMTDLGTLGGRHSGAGGINESGQVVGNAAVTTSQPYYHAFLWEDGVMNDLTPGLNTANASAINESGQVVGTISSTTAFLWDDGVITELGSLGTAFGGSFASDINDAGQVVGSSSTDFVTQLGVMPHAFHWQDGVMTDLGVLPGDTESGASGINTQGQVVGSSGNTDPETYEVTSHAFLYESGVMSALNVPSFRSSATDINDHGQIVGTMRAVGGFSHDHAFIYQNGVATDLNSLIAPGSGLTLTFAYAINNAGMIVGTAVDSAWKSHAFLLTPIDPGLAQITIGNATVVEGHTGTRSANFAVTLSAAMSEPVTLAYATANGSATGGSDYQAASGTVTFAPGQTSQTVTVLVNGDRVGEPNETFIVNLSEASSNAVIADPQGIGTITDDEPRVSIGEMSKKEGNSGTTQFIFTVTLTAPSSAPVTVNFATADSDAKAGEDYVAKSGSVTFSPGQTTKTISITVLGDRKKEVTEWFSVNLTSASGALIQYGKGFGRIINDD